MLIILFLLIALVLFVLAALNVASPRVGLVPAGLACVVASMLVPLL